ncbi:hypothetical protein MRX96_024471 [Rhipicephalus microplus]
MATVTYMSQSSCHHAEPKKPVASPQDVPCHQRTEARRLLVEPKTSGRTPASRPEPSSAQETFVATSIIVLMFTTEDRASSKCFSTPRLD